MNIHNECVQPLPFYRVLTRRFVYLQVWVCIQQLSSTVRLHRGTYGKYMYVKQPLVRECLATYAFEWLWNWHSPESFKRLQSLRSSIMYADLHSCLSVCLSTAVPIHNPQSQWCHSLTWLCNSKPQVWCVTLCFCWNRSIHNCTLSLGSIIAAASPCAVHVGAMM